MKKRIVFVMSTVCALSLVWCGTRAAHHANTEHPYAGAPKIVLDGQNYLAKELDIVNELPEGYSYAGELTDQEKEFADINGKNITFRMERSLSKISMSIRSAEPQ